MNAGALRPAVFLDKDGTLVENVPYNVDPACLRIVEGASASLRRLRSAGYLLVMVSNQPGIALGRFTVGQLHAINGVLQERLAGDGAELDAIYFCPHAPAGHTPHASCGCRKPAPGMLLKAAQELAIDLRRSWMVGDILDDVQAGRRAGCRSALVDVGNETLWETGPDRVPDAWIPHISHLADAIVGPSRHGL